MKTKQQLLRRANKEKCYNDTAIIDAIYNLRPNHHPTDETMSNTREIIVVQRRREMKTKQKLFNSKRPADNNVWCRRVQLPPSPFVVHIGT